MRTEGSRGLMITYDPPSDDDDDEGSGSLSPPPSASANQFPVNTQEICYINVRVHYYLQRLTVANHVTTFFF